MSRIRANLTAAALGAGLVLSTAASAAIVVASSGPSAARYPAGKKLDDAGQITLQAGDSITVLDKHGTKVLRGPGRRPVSQPGRPLPNPAYAVLIRKDAANRARAGAVRTGNDGKPLSPNLWLVDIDRPGTKCVTAPDAVQLWRADTRKAARYRISAPGSTSPTASFVSFASGSAWANWPAGPIVEGRRYILTSDDGAAINSVTFAIVDDPPADAEDLALKLVRKGCTGQLNLLSQTLAVSPF